jgi:hypothetical protein
MFTSVRTTFVAGAVVWSMSAPVPALAQTEPALKAAFEGRRVTVRIDMPGTSDGIDVEADAREAINYSKYRDNLKRYGTAIHAGDRVTVTFVKVKKDLIEFQLGGGGYGTFGDDTSTSVSMSDAPKTDREKELERLVKDEEDRDRRRRLERELDDLRERRERENRRIAIARERAEEEKKERLAERRMRGGSRFNLRYDDRVPEGFRPEDLIAALGDYVDFGGLAPRATADDPPIVTLRDEAPLPAGDVALPRKGMLRADAERLYGRPSETSERREGALSVTTLVFVTGDQRLRADFVGDVLVGYTLTSK